MKVPNFIVQAADELAKDTHLPFRDCLDILVRAYLADAKKWPNEGAEISSREIATLACTASAS